MPLADELIGSFDRALRTLAGVAPARRPSPAAEVSDTSLSTEERRLGAALMRVNHVGEVCAQALYEGQALTARDPGTRSTLLEASEEERDHLAWCAARIAELGGRESLLNPLWYGGSLVFGAVAGAIGDRWNLAFLAETERQVEEHLTGHLGQLSANDARTRRLIEAMRADEARHRETALRLGAAELPETVKAAMRVASKVMTTVSYRI
ncbi:MAG TPA: 2-polyprenyl-3-methyl-6-methoxy-1,4-benzoquinone monooxygenase [Burkholderiales bacterium]|nr:2-polyprenyl-3-methyl-6-methoxy-1,4-benzoquinone monooxygenase [Burkholderiales bacterium]